MGNAYILIAGMALVTYLSRVTPFLVLPKDGLPPLLERFLAFVPPAAIGALIFPDALSGPPGHPHAAVVAALCAALIATRSRALWMTVGSAILLVFAAIGVGLL